MIKRAIRKFIYGAQAQAFTTWVEFTNEMRLMRKVRKPLATPMRACNGAWTSGACLLTRQG